MGYSLSAFIAKAGVFAPYQTLSSCITIVPMAQGFEMLLNDEFLREAIGAQTEFAQAEPHLVDLQREQFELVQERNNVEDRYPADLTDALVSFGLSLSLQQPIAYVEAEFWGGTGEQYAVLWHEGQIALLPSTNGLPSEHYRNHEFVFLKDAPINTVLRVLGVQIERLDEFASLGLMMERNTSDWFRRFNPHTNDCKAER